MAIKGERMNASRVTREPHLTETMEIQMWPYHEEL